MLEKSRQNAEKPRKCFSEVFLPQNWFTVPSECNAYTRNLRRV